MSATGTSLVAFLIAVSFAAGLNLYATVACIGVLARVGWLDLPPTLQLLASAWIIVPAVALFLIEVFADRVPFLGLAWNIGHIFLRAPVAALLAYHATTELSPVGQLAVALLSGVIAAIAHSSKTATRVAAAEGGAYVPSFAMNGSGDALAILVVVTAARHPVLMATVVLGFVLLTVLLVRKMCRAMANEAKALREHWAAWRNRRTLSQANH